MIREIDGKVVSSIRVYNNKEKRAILPDGSIGGLIKVALIAGAY